jgi:hypothetical protein
MLFAVTDFQADVVVGRVRLGDDVQALFDEHRRHFFNRRAHRRLHEAVHLVARREMHRLAQALAPAARAA